MFERYTIRLSIVDNSTNEKLLDLSQGFEKDLSIVEFFKQTVPGWQALINTTVAPSEEK